MSNMNEIIGILHRFKNEIKSNTNQMELLVKLKAERFLDPKAGKKEIAYSRIFMTTNYHCLICDDFTTHHKETYPELHNAISLYEEWFHEDLYLNEVSKYSIEEPKKNETLINYLIKIHEKIFKEKGWKTIYERSLRSFLSFLRSKFNNENLFFIDKIFPQEMEAFGGIIIPKLPPQSYPIDIFMVSRILEELINQVINARSNAKKTAAETLALCWLCLTLANKKIPLGLKQIYELPPEAITFEVKKNQEPKSKIIHPHDSFHGSFLLIPMLNNPVLLRISKFLKEYLLCLHAHTKNIKPGKNQILTSPLKSLHRTLRETIEAIPVVNEHGNIKFSTFTNFPHEQSFERGDPSRKLSHQYPDYYPSN